jgi:hypothetical protein
MDGLSCGQSIVSSCLIHTLYFAIFHAYTLHLCNLKHISVCVVCEVILRSNDRMYPGIVEATLSAVCHGFEAWFSNVEVFGADQNEMCISIVTLKCVTRIMLLGAIQLYKNGWEGKRGSSLSWHGFSCLKTCLYMSTSGGAFLARRICRVTHDAFKSSTPSRARLQ